MNTIWLHTECCVIALAHLHHHHLRDIALTVQELEDGEFYWVLMEGTDNPTDAADESLAFVPLEAASEPHTSYANALVAGVAAMRRMFGHDGPRDRCG